MRQAARTVHMYDRTENARMIVFVAAGTDTQQHAGQQHHAQSNTRINGALRTGGTDDTNSRLMAADEEVVVVVVVVGVVVVMVVAMSSEPPRHAPSELCVYVVAGTGLPPCACRHGRQTAR